jgi:RNA polymerase sigma-70 factor (ECF subfamily)
VRATSADCYALALHLVGNEHDARDALQDAYLRAFRSVRKFRGDSSFATWLHRITVNCSMTLVTKRRRSSHAVLEDDLELAETRADSDPEAVAGTLEDRGRLVKALAGLPDQMRMVIVLRDVYDLAHEEIARELGISQAAAKVRLHRARRCLRDELFAPAPGAPSADHPVARPGDPVVAQERASIHSFGAKTARSRSAMGRNGQLGEADGDAAAI